MRFFGTALLLALCFATLAPGSSREVSLADRNAAASQFVAQKLQVWQGRMNLSDWKIRVELVRADQLEPRTLGNVHWDTDVKTATIDVLSPQDYTLPQKEMLDDMEVTIVHELVHIELASLPRSDASRRVEEHAVNEITGALLRLAQQK